MCVGCAWRLRDTSSGGRCAGRRGAALAACASSPRFFFRSPRPPRRRRPASPGRRKIQNMLSNNCLSLGLFGIGVRRTGGFPTLPKNFSSPPHGPPAPGDRRSTASWRAGTVWTRLRKRRSHQRVLRRRRPAGCSTALRLTPIFGRHRGRRQLPRRRPRAGRARLRISDRGPS